MLLPDFQKWLWQSKNHTSHKQYAGNSISDVPALWDHVEVQFNIFFLTFSCLTPAPPYDCCLLIKKGGNSWLSLSYLLVLIMTPFPRLTKHPQMLEKCQGAHYSRQEHIQGFRRWLVWIFHSNVPLHWPQLQIVVHTFHPPKEPTTRKDNQMCDRVCSGMCILISAEQEARVQQMICDAFILP